MVSNDVLVQSDTGNQSALFILDINKLTVAVDYQILTCLTVVSFIQYLSDRSLCLAASNSRSSLSHLSFGVPQGSVLGPSFFAHGVEFYIFFKPYEVLKQHVLRTCLDCVLRALLVLGLPLRTKDILEEGAAVSLFRQLATLLEV
uniref:Reverse transcriptase domain-containing protein n=1 Tax=Fundulus heteroclitus TaxID=8078 RepID=A0A3Q2PE63_FUNHE